MENSKIIKRDKIEEIFSNLNIDEVKKEVMKVAIEYSPTTGIAFAELNLEDGTVGYGFLERGLTEDELNADIKICTQEVNRDTFDYPLDETTVNTDLQDEIEELMNEDTDLDFEDALSVVMEKHNISADEIIEEYLLEYEVKNVDYISIIEFKRQLDEIYN